MFSIIALEDAENNAPVLCVNEQGAPRYRVYKDKFYNEDKFYIRYGTEFNQVPDYYSHILSLKEGLKLTFYVPVKDVSDSSSKNFFLEEEKEEDKMFFLVWNSLGVNNCKLSSLRTLAYSARFENSVNSVNVDNFEQLTDAGKDYAKNLVDIADVVVNMLQIDFDNSVEEFNKQTKVLLNNNTDEELVILEEKARNLEFLGERLAMFTKIVNMEEDKKQQCLFSDLDLDEKDFKEED